MRKPDSRNDIPVVMLYNLDRQWPAQDIEECVVLTENLSRAIQEVGHPVTSACLEDDDLVALLRQFEPEEVIIFNWCEEIPGIPRSSAQVAQELERLGFIFTGSDSSVLALSQDKNQVKRRFRAEGIPTPDWEYYPSSQSVCWDRFPAIVKLAYEHCSIGIERESVVQSHTNLLQRVDYVIEAYHQPVVVEEFIDGREFHVGVLGNGQPQVLQPAEIDFSAFDDIHDRICTYESNFNPKSIAYQLTKTRLPADLTGDEIRTLEKVCLEAYHVLGCRDYARLDLRLREGIFYVLDVNPNADLTPETSLIAAAEMAGYPYGQFGSLLVNLAAQRHTRLAQLFW